MPLYCNAETAEFVTGLWFYCLFYHSAKFCFNRQVTKPRDQERKWISALSPVRTDKSCLKCGFRTPQLTQQEKSMLCFCFIFRWFPHRLHDDKRGEWQLFDLTFWQVKTSMYSLLALHTHALVNRRVWLLSSLFPSLFSHVKPFNSHIVFFFFTHGQTTSPFVRFRICQVTRTLPVALLTSAAKSCISSPWIPCSLRPTARLSFSFPLLKNWSTHSQACE